MLATLAGKLAARRKNCAPLAGKSTLNRLEQAPSAPSRYHKIGHDAVAIEGCSSASSSGRTRHRPRGSFSISTPRTTRCTGIRRAGSSTVTHMRRLSVKCGEPIRAEPGQLARTGLSARNSYPARSRGPRTTIRVPAGKAGVRADGTTLRRGRPVPAQCPGPITIHPVSVARGRAPEMCSPASGRLHGRPGRDEAGGDEAPQRNERLRARATTAIARQPP